MAILIASWFSAGRLSVGKKGLDVILVVDVSSSIGPESLNIAKRFMKILVEIFGVSPERNGRKLIRPIYSNSTSKI